MSDPPPAYRVPAEWEPLDCLWLAWPHNRQTWPGRFEEIPDFFARWVATVAESVAVRVVADVTIAAHCQSMIAQVAAAEIVDIPTNDCWIRDYGPTFVVDSRDESIQGINWRYNAWGGKYAPWDLDNAAARRICHYETIPCADSPLCVEGGALEFDGTGRLLTTVDCLLTDTRNPNWSQQQIESELTSRLGLHEILWLSGGGLEGDDTDGHIDQIARFLAPDTIVAAVCQDKTDPNHEPLAENFRQLIEWAERTSPAVSVHPLPIPPPRRIDAQRVPESYCNFLRLGPDRILVPTFGAPTDSQALGLLQDLTGLKPEPMDCRDLVWGLGALHCASRDQPVVYW
jgi:agmatine deiminase